VCEVWVSELQLCVERGSSVGSKVVTCDNMALKDGERKNAREFQDFEYI